MPEIILGVSITRRAIGLALLYDGELRDWSIHTDNLSAQNRLSDALLKYPVKHMAFIASDTKQRTSAITKFVELANRQNVTTSKHSIYELKQRILGRHRSKKSLFLYLTEFFPELETMFYKFLQKRNPYLNVLFESVACAHINS